MAFLPNTRPPDQTKLGEWTEREFRRLAETLNLATDMLRLETTNVAPAKPRAGDIRLADGTNWNPGSGAGFYGYYGGAWVKLG